ncbi:MAG: Wyosine base formation [Methanomicrobia archaeon]|nr:Wyosine base formation [Methanomicrobia archaeon]
MRSRPCDPLKRQGYQFVTPGSSAAVKPCLWCVKALKGGEQCYKHQFYGIESHRCVQMTPTLRCTQRCLFCWRSFEHEPAEEGECPPDLILDRLAALQKRALSGYKPVAGVTPERFREALDPRHVASPFQLYVSLSAPDEETYCRLCRPKEEGSWERLQESLHLLGTRRSAIRITLVQGWNDHSPERYGALLQGSGARFVEVKGYMYLGYSRTRLQREHMPEHGHVRAFAETLQEHADYRIRDENRASRVVCMERVA